MSEPQQRYNATMVDNSKRIDELKKELTRDSRSRQFYQLGELLRRDGRLNEAADVLRGGLKHHARYVAAWVALGRTCLDLGHGRESEAAEALTQALGLDAQNPVAWRLLGEARLACGQRGAALEAMQRALDLVPGDEVLKAAVDALLAEVEPAALAVPAAPMRAEKPQRREPPPAVQPEPPLSAESPFVFETAPMDLEKVPALPETVAAEPAGEVAARLPEPLPVHQDLLPEPAVVAEELEGGFGLGRDGDLATPDPFGLGETPTWPVPPSPAEHEMPMEEASFAGADDVFGGPGVSPGAAVGMEVAEAPALPIQPLAEAEAAPIPTEARGPLPGPAVTSGVEALPPEEGHAPTPAVEVAGETPVPAVEPAATEPRAATGVPPEPMLAGELPPPPAETTMEPAMPEPLHRDGEPAIAGADESLPAEPGTVTTTGDEVGPELGETEPLVAAESVPAEPLGDVPALHEAPPAVAPVEEHPASITLARLFLRQQEMTAAVEVLERVLEREPDNQEARDLLLLVRDMMEEAPVQPIPALSVGERKIAALQRWLARMEQGRERMAP